MVAEGVLKLTSLSLYGTDVKSDITSELFNIMAGRKDLKLKKINLGRGQNHISNIKPVIFAKAVSKLEEVCLQDCNLTSEQLKLMFQDLILKTSSIEVLSLTFENGEANIDKEFIGKALMNVKDVEYEDMDPTYFDTFIDLVKHTPDVKTRYISVDPDINTHQERLVKALLENPHIEFSSS